MLLAPALDEEWVKFDVCGEVDLFFFSLEGCVSIEIGDEGSAIPPPTEWPLRRSFCSDHMCAADGGGGTVRRPARAGRHSHRLARCDPGPRVHNRPGECAAARAVQLTAALGRRGGRSVVVIAGPKTDLLQPEADMLQRFLSKGGHVFVMTDPPDEKSPPTPVLTALLKDWDFQVGNDVVVDASGMGQLIGTDASVPVVATYPSHPITERFQLLTAFPLARSITPIPAASTVTRRRPIIADRARAAGPKRTWSS